LEDAPALKFLLRFEGLVWNLLATDDILLVEVRNQDKKQVSFSAFSMTENSFVWKERILEENWWVNASAITSDKVIFTVYMDTNNPDKKGIVVYSLNDLTLLWWNNDFSLSEIGSDSVKGFTSKLGLKEVVLDLSTGAIKDHSVFKPSRATSSLEKPVQYTEGSPHFETVQKFLADRLNFPAVFALEYLETGGNIIISCYSQEEAGLANYLFVLSAEGKVLLKEKLDGPLKGIGLDTFFMLKGCVIFVRNRVELVSYKII
jgi:hypothetical protein